MKNDKNKLDVGDVISSKKFAFGFFNKSKEIIYADGKTKNYILQEFRSEEERLDTAIKTGKIPSELIDINLSAYDESRGDAKFVVEAVALTGGGHGHGFNDIYPDGWNISARRLNKDGSYSESNEIINFYTTGCFNCLINIKDIKILGKMKMQFI